MTDISRRALLGSAFVAGIGAIAGTSLLTGCTSSPSGAAAVKGSAGVLPNYIQYASVKPDYPALPNGTPAGFENYPADAKWLYKGKPGDGKAISSIVQLNGAPPTPLASNQFWQQLNSKIGSEMQVQEVTAGNDFVAKISTIEASGDYPDLMQLNPALPSIGQFVGAEVVDLAPYLAGDKIKDYPFLANIPQQFWQACVFNGKLVGVPISRGAASGSVMYFRGDLADQLGLPSTFTSFSEFSDALTAATDAKSNRWGMVSNPLNYVRQMYKIPNNYEKTKSGAFTSAYEDEHQKDALEAVRKLQAAGVIQPDMATTTPAQGVTKFGQGVGVYHWSSYTAYASDYSQFHATNPAFKIGLLNLPGYDGGKGRAWFGNLNNNWVSIPVTSKSRVKSLLQVIEWLSAPFGTAEYLFQRYGVEGVNYTLQSTNPTGIPGKGGDILGIGYLGSGPYVLYAPGTPYAKVAHDHMSGYLTGSVIDPTNLYYSPTYSTKGAGLTSAMTATELDIIYGRKPVSAWDDAVASWKSGGGDDIKKELATAAEKPTPSPSAS